MQYRDVLLTATHQTCNLKEHREYLIEGFRLAHGQSEQDVNYPSVHVHRPPAVTLNKTPEEFHISTGLR
jgi:hypothetical protein